MNSKFIRLLRESQTARFFLPFGLVAILMGVLNLPGLFSAEGSPMWSGIFFAVGALCVIGAINSFAQVGKKEKEREAQEATFAQKPVKTVKVSVKAPPKTEGTTTYTVYPDENVTKQGLLMENGTGMVVCEAKGVKRSLTSTEFEFKNYLTGKTVSHKVGLTTTTGEGVTAKSGFKLDGKNVWDYLHGEGIRIGTDLHASLGATYTVTLKGEPYGTVDITLKHPHQFQVVTSATDLDLLFLTVFAMDHTEQTVLD